jgi:hypothetical protein
MGGVLGKSLRSRHPSGAFIRGFMKGATEIHDEIADQL